MTYLKKKFYIDQNIEVQKKWIYCLSNFVKKYINDFGIVELKQLDDLLNFDDDSLFKWYLNKKGEIKIPNNKVSNLLKNFKI